MSGQLKTQHVKKYEFGSQSARIQFSQMRDHPSQSIIKDGANDARDLFSKTGKDK